MPRTSTTPSTPSRTSRGQSGGWHLIVAIADVAHYVLPVALDREAYKRGNRLFPGPGGADAAGGAVQRLVLAAPEEDRGCLAVEMRIDRDGELKAASFMRGLMRSHARLTYDQVQEARTATPTGRPARCSSG